MGALRTLIFVGVVTLASSSARADAVDTVSIGGVCLPSGTSAPDVLRILQAELAPADVRWVDGAPTPRGPDDVVLEIRTCNDAPPTAEITVWQRGESTELSIALTDATPGTRSRTFALALAESVHKVAANPPEPSFVVSPVAPRLEVVRVAERPRNGDSNDSAKEPETRPTRPSEALALRGRGVFRFVPKSSTPLGGADVAVTGRGFAGGLVVLGTERSTSLGTASLFAVAVEASADVLSLAPDWAIRAEGEIGVAVASGSPDTGATGHTVAGLHSALGAGVAALVPFGAGFTFDGYAGGGYGSSLQADANGKNAAGLDGWFVAVNAGVRLPL